MTEQLGQFLNQLTSCFKNKFSQFTFILGHIKYEIMTVLNLTVEDWAHIIIEDGREYGVHTLNYTDELYDQLLLVAGVIKPVVDDNVKEVLTVIKEAGFGKYYWQSGSIT